MEISKIINTKELISVSMLFEVVDNKPRKVAELKMYKSKTGFSDFYTVMEIYATEKDGFTTGYKNAAGRNVYKNVAVADVAQNIGMTIDDKHNADANSVFSQLAAQLKLKNPYITQS